MKKGPSEWSIYRPNRLKSGHLRSSGMVLEDAKIDLPHMDGGGGGTPEMRSPEGGQKLVKKCQLGL